MSNETKSDADLSQKTPLTDALDEAVFHNELRYFRMRKHARDLERQLAEAKRLVEEKKNHAAALLEEMANSWNDEVDGLKAKFAEARKDTERLEWLRKHFDAETFFQSDRLQEELQELVDNGWRNLKNYARKDRPMSEYPTMSMAVDKDHLILLHRKEIDRLTAQLAEAVSLLREGKKQFTPHTTNSDVDEFLKRHKKEESQ
jgi:hypothetical protein